MPDPSKSLVMAFISALKRGDMDGMRALLHPDFAVSEADGLPYAGIYRGGDGWQKLCRAVITVWKKFHIELLELVCESDTQAVVRFAISGRSSVSGREFNSTVLELWRIDDGKIREILPYYWDTHELHLAHKDAQAALG
jgi:uncharacterized protein